jgi:hypothetical protein
LHKKWERHRNIDHAAVRNHGGVLSLEKRESIIKFVPVKSASSVPKANSLE